MQRGKRIAAAVQRLPLPQMQALGYERVELTKAVTIDANRQAELAYAAIGAARPELGQRHDGRSGHRSLCAVTRRRHLVSCPCSIKRRVYAGVRHRAAARETTITSVKRQRIDRPAGIRK